MTRPNIPEAAAREIWGLVYQGKLTGEEQIREVIEKYRAAKPKDTVAVIDSDSTGARPQWLVNASAEIAGISAMRSKDVEAIILKHCPEAPNAVIDSDSTEARPDWMTAIANDVRALVARCFVYGTERWSNETIEIIVERHCPEEFSEGLWAKMCVTQQAAEKLVEALKAIEECKCKIGHSLNSEGRCQYCKEKANLALAAYEKATKRPPSEETHDPGSSRATRGRAGDRKEKR